MQFFNKMKCNKKGWNLTIFISFRQFKACANLGTLEDGKCVYHQIIQNGLDMNVFVVNNLVSKYAKCGNIQDECSITCHLKIWSIKSQLTHPQTPWKIQMRIRRWKQWKKKNQGALFNSQHFKDKKGVLKL
jgi:hypothetical protein